MKVACALAYGAVAAIASPVDLSATYDAERAEFVAELNATPDMTWKAAVHERFAGRKLGAHLRELAGVTGDIGSDIAAAVEKGEIEVVSSFAADIPEAFDSATNFPECADMINDIRDQSACGCCWAFGAAEAASDRMCIASKAQMVMPLSAQDVCFCGSANGCGGGQLSTAWLHIKYAGSVTGGQYDQTGPYTGFCSAFSLPHCHHHGPQGNDPYPNEGTPGCPNASSPSCPHKCDDAAVAPHTQWKQDKISFKGKIQHYTNEKAIQTALMAGGPVEAAFSVYSDFENYAGGVYQHTSGTYEGGHAIKIVGWGVDNGTKYWNIANSWNPYWGESGHFRILRGSNHCGIESGTMAAAANADWHLKH